MRHMLVAFALALSACSTAPARADTGIEADPGVLNACVASAGAERAALEACVGAMARPCIDANGGSSMAHVLCWDAEATAWRAMLANAHAPSYRSADLLTAANQSWEAWVDAECGYWAWEEGGGSGEQVDRVRCVAHLSAQRAIALRVGQPP